MVIGFDAYNTHFRQNNTFERVTLCNGSEVQDLRACCDSSQSLCLSACTHMA